MRFLQREIPLKISTPVIVFFLALLGGGYYFYHTTAQKSEQPSQRATDDSQMKDQEDGEKVEEPEAPIDCENVKPVVGDWEVFCASQEGFAFDYPSDWRLERDTINKPIKDPHREEALLMFGLGCPEEIGLGTSCAKVVVSYFTKRYPDETVGDWLRDFSDYRKLTVGGEKAYQEPFGRPYRAYNTNVLFMHDGYRYMINYEVQPEYRDQTSPIFEKILSSFRFLD